MDNQKQLIQSKKEMKDDREEFCRSNDDHFIFVPAENIRAIERVIDNWEEVKQQWDKIKI